MRNSLSPGYLYIIFFFIILITACEKIDPQPNISDSPSLEATDVPQDLIPIEDIQRRPTKTRSLSNFTTNQGTPKAQDRKNNYTSTSSKKTLGASTKKLAGKVKNLISPRKPTKEKEQDTQQAAKKKAEKAARKEEKKKKEAKKKAKKKAEDEAKKKAEEAKKKVEEERKKEEEAAKKKAKKEKKNGKEPQLKTTRVCHQFMRTTAAAK